MNSGHVYGTNAPSSRKNRRGASTVSPNFYDEFSPIGSVTSPEEQARNRERQGYCTTCKQHPIKLFDIKKNKLNPLRRIKAPLTVAGQSFEGKCLACHPHLDPDRSHRKIHRSSRKGGLGSSSSRSGIRTVGKSSPSLSPTGSGRSLSSGYSQESITNSIPRGSSSSSLNFSSSSARPLHDQVSHQSRRHGHHTPTSPLTPRQTRNPVPSPISSDYRSTPRERSSPSRYVGIRNLSDDAIVQGGLGIPGAQDALNDSSDVLHFSGSSLGTSSSSLQHTPSRSSLMAQGQSMSSCQLDTRRQDDSNLDDGHKSCPDISLQRGPRRPVFSQTVSARTGDLGLESSSSSFAAGPHPSLHGRDASIPSLAADVSTSMSEEESEVAGLKLLIKEASGNAEFTADILANAVRDKSVSDPMKIFFLETVCSTCKHNEENKSYFISMGIHEDVLNTMLSNLDHARVQELACGAIWTMSVSERNRRFLGKAGAAGCVFRALERHESDQKVSKTAISALRTVSPDAGIQQELAQYECAALVARNMGLHTSVLDIQRDGCAFLSNMAVNMEAKSVSVVSYEEMKAVVRAIGYHTKSDKVVSSACFALKNYTYAEQNLRTMRRFHELKELLRDVSRYGNSSSSREDALDILEAIEMSEQTDASLETIVASSFHDIAAGPDAVSNLIGIISDYGWSPKLVCDGLDSLSELAERSDSHRRKIVESNFIEKIIDCMNHHEADAGIQHRCCNLFRETASNSQGRSAVCRTEACASMLRAMQNHSKDEPVQVAAVTTLMVIASEVQFASEKQHKDVMAAMQDALQRFPHNEELQRAGAKVVASLSTRI